MGGRLVFPGGGIYHATKYAVEAISDALRFEVRGFGVDVILIEPGLIMTGFGEVAVAARSTHRRRRRRARTRTSTAAWRRPPRSAYNGPMAKLGGGPEAVAATIAKALNAERPKARYPVTASAHLLIDQREVTPDAHLGPDDARAVPDAEGLSRPSAREPLAQLRTRSPASASAPVSSSDGEGPVATAKQRTPSACAQAMSRGVSPITIVRSRGCGHSDGAGPAAGDRRQRGAVLGVGAESRPARRRSAGRSRRARASAARPARSCR